MSPRRTGNACAVCGRRCRYARELCSTCRPVVWPQLLRLRDTAVYPAGPR